MNKFKIIFNVLFLVFAVVFIEIFSYVKLTKSFTHGNAKFYFLKFYNQKTTDIRYNYLNRYKNESLLYNARNYNINSSDDKSIIIFGCSMAYGWKLKDNGTFGYKLSKKLDKTVYNRSFPGGGIMDTVFQLHYDNFYKYIKKDPDYVLYFYIPDHLRRMVMRGDPTTKAAVVFYKLRKGKLIEKSPFILEDSYTYNLIQYYINETAKKSEKIKRIAGKIYMPLFEAALKNIDDTIKEKYPNAKFIIVTFAPDNFIEKYSKKYNVIDLEKYSGIILRDDEKYWVDKSSHPNEKYWDIVTPIIIEKMKSFK